MTASTASARPRWSRPIRRLLLLLGIPMALAGCGAAPRVELPSELPLRSNDQLFTLEWALQRETSVVRGTGRVTPSIDSEATLTLGFFGLDAGGRIVSRGTAYLRSDFSSRSIPFAVELTPTGRESTFVLRVLNYHIPGLRMS